MRLNRILFKGLILFALGILAFSLMRVSEREQIEYMTAGEIIAVTIKTVPTVMGELWSALIPIAEDASYGLGLNGIAFDLAPFMHSTITSFLALSGALIALVGVGERNVSRTWQSGRFVASTTLLKFWRGAAPVFIAGLAIAVQFLSSGWMAAVLAVPGAWIGLKAARITEAMLWFLETVAGVSVGPWRPLPHPQTSQTTASGLVAAQRRQSTSLSAAPSSPPEPARTSPPQAALQAFGLSADCTRDQLDAAFRHRVRATTDSAERQRLQTLRAQLMQHFAWAD